MDTTLRNRQGAPRPAAGESPATAPAPPAADPPWPRLVGGLAEELSQGDWSYPWQLAPGVGARCSAPSARSLAWTFAATIERPCRDALLLDPEPSALVLGAGDGPLAHWLLDWGANHVVAWESAGAQLERARQIREQLGLPEQRLSFHSGAEAPPGTFSVVVIAPAATTDPAPRAAALAAARDLCAIAAPGEDADRVARAGVEAGISPIELVQPPRYAHPSYVLGERVTLIGSPAVAT